MSQPITVRPPAAPSAAAATVPWPDTYVAPAPASSVESTSDVSPSTVNTADTSLSSVAALSAVGSDSKECPGPPAGGQTRDVAAAPFRPRTPPHLTTSWRYSMPDPGLASPPSELTSPERGAKRTASGAFKFASPSVLSPVRSAKHARNASTDSAQSRVSELSAQLKARLSYAMVKVQNGWEHKSISEVEHLAMHSPNFSPRNRGAHGRARQGRSRGASDAAVMQATKALYQQPGLSSAITLQELPNPFRSVPQLTTPQSGYNDRVSPPGIGSGRPVTSHELNKLTGAPAGSLKPQPYSSLRATTPTPQEQDALDSLVSMSSPAHSVRYSRKYPNGTSNAASTAASSLQGSPTRTVFPPNGTSSKPGSMPPPALHSQSSRGSGSSTGLEAMVARKSVLNGPVRTNGDVERLIDEVQAQSSDEAEQEL